MQRFKNSLLHRITVKNLSILFICCFSFFLLPLLQCTGDVLPLPDSSEQLRQVAQAEPPEIIRLHVKAHNNDCYEQELKNEVVCAILEHFSPRWKSCSSREELYQLLEKDRDDITVIAEQVLDEQGISREVTVQLASSTFPARLYEGSYYPPGEYEALMVVIGAGKGENWWCVLFPPLCFGVVPAPRDKSGCEETATESAEETADATEQEEQKWRLWLFDYFT